LPCNLAAREYFMSAGERYGDFLERCPSGLWSSLGKAV